MLANMQFPMAVESVEAARTFVTETLAHCDKEIIEIARLLTTELATNAVIHAQTAFDIRLSRHGSLVRVAISDDSAETPTMRPMRRSAPSGRGLLLLNALAAEWGVDTSPPGKIVWFQLLCT